MTNYEKYKDEIAKALKDGAVLDFASKHCDGNIITNMNLYFPIWMMQEYKEPEVDWTKVKVNTPILVKTSERDMLWKKRYFAKYKDGKVYAWYNGATSWSCEGDFDETTIWRYAKLAEDGE